MYVRILPEFLMLPYRCNDVNEFSDGIAMDRS